MHKHTTVVMFISLTLFGFCAAKAQRLNNVTLYLDGGSAAEVQLLYVGDSTLVAEFQGGSGEVPVRYSLHGINCLMLKNVDSVSYECNRSIPATTAYSLLGIIPGAVVGTVLGALVGGVIQPDADDGHGSFDYLSYAGVGMLAGAIAGGLLGYSITGCDIESTTYYPGDPASLRLLKRHSSIDGKLPDALRNLPCHSLTDN